MGKQTGISWTDHTFNPWWGCEKISPACAHCYADTFAKRVGHGGTKPKLWGPGSERRMFGDAHWNEPLRWDQDAMLEGLRRRVFCASMADVFEDRPELAAPRARLFALIEATSHLDWLLLTKRPENMEMMAPERWAGFWPRNVFAGCTAETQELLDERWMDLVQVPAAVRFLSIEPMLGPISVTHALEWIGCPTCSQASHNENFPPNDCCEQISAGDARPALSWVIVGGESGPGARPMRPEWARTLRDECATQGVAFHFKQWGEWMPEGQQPLDAVLPKDGDGGPSFYRVGKRAAGRELDGVTHDAFPEVRWVARA